MKKTSNKDENQMLDALKIENPRFQIFSDFGGE
jgi:hypothetical protein